ncbi:MAG: bifunctional ornithine acetyltransferase/N-acetylglutamate synthase [Spirochaetales bacterium]|nr:bifunctional ornithine acetyltransferase/N-acetylglutamate synthase [Spirochaetales bacterium]
MITYRSAEEYQAALSGRASLPEGFRAGCAALSFVPREKPGTQSMNLSLILLDEPTPAFAAVTTRNRFCGAPVRICRERLKEKAVRGVLVNNRVANVGSPTGEEDARGILEHLGGLLGAPGSQFLPASTGVVGWGLPRAEMEAALPALVASLQPGTLLPVAQGIMTTDSYPKLHREAVGEGAIVGTVKGAGMIEPNMATLLGFVITDLRVGREELREALAFAVENSFNRISVDGDQSTSDMVLALSSGRRPGVGRGEFRTALLALCRRLAEDVVRNGEGVGHVIRVRVRGAEPPAALGAGKAVINSPLVKTAIFGNDPNVGRIVAALGDYAGNTEIPGVDPGNFRVSLGGIGIFERGSFTLDPERERQLAGYLRECALEPGRVPYPAHDRAVEIEVDLGAGSAAGSAAEIEVIGADLSYEYVRENADYRS